MKDEVIAVVIVVTETTESDSDASGIRSRSSTRAYDEGWERTFGKKQEHSQRPQDLN